MDAEEFVQAAWRGDLDSVRAWLDDGGDPNATGPTSNIGGLCGSTLEIVDLLLDAGADPAATYPDGGSPLGWQIWEVRVPIIERLLAAGAPVPDPDDEGGESELHQLTCSTEDQDDRLAVIRLLLAAGADPNHATTPGVLTGAYWRGVHTLGETPLHRAAAHCSREIIEALLDAGADTGAADVNGELPMAWASRHWREPAIIDLLGHGDDYHPIGL